MRKFPCSAAGGEHAINGDFVHQIVYRDFFCSLFAKPLLRTKEPVFNLPRMVFKDRRWPEEAHRWASGGSSEVHGCRIHAHEKNRILQKECEVRPRSEASRSGYLWAQYGTERSGFSHFFFAWSTAENDMRHKMQKLTEKFGPSLDRPRFACPSGVDVNNSIF